MTSPDPSTTSSFDSAGMAPDLDVAAGIERLMGNRPIYLRALARFRSDYRGATAAIRTALAGEDLPLARRLVHTLKGAAGMIEAGPLHAAALALEEALRLGAPGADALLERVDAALSRVMHALESLQVDEAGGEPVADAGADVLERLRGLLDRGDGAAVELVGAAHGTLRRELGEPACADLSEAVAAFDYERALALLDRPRRRGS